MPNTSPRRSVNVADPGSNASTSSTGSPSRRSPRAKRSDAGAPTISATMASGVAPAVAPPPTLRPSRSTT